MDNCWDCGQRANSRADDDSSSSLELTRDEVDKGHTHTRLRMLRGFHGCAAESRPTTAQQSQQWLTRW